MIRVRPHLFTDDHQILDGCQFGGVNSGDSQQVINRSEITMGPTIFSDARRQAGADPRKPLEFGLGCLVDIEFVGLTSRRIGGQRIGGRLSQFGDGWHVHPGAVLKGCGQVEEAQGPPIDGPAGGFDRLADNRVPFQRVDSGEVDSAGNMDPDGSGGGCGQQADGLTARFG